MQTRVTYTAEGVNPRQNYIVSLNESVEALIKRLGGIVMNSSYLLTDGWASEAYGYYMFPRLAIIKTSLKIEDGEYIFSVDFYGFEGKIDKYNKLKRYIEDTLKKVLY